jgi:hypothetical protein
MNFNSTYAGYCQMMHMHISDRHVMDFHCLYVHVCLTIPMSKSPLLLP